MKTSDWLLLLAGVQGGIYMWVSGDVHSRFRGLGGVLMVM
jgi:hypothetical protein